MYNTINTLDYGSLNIAFHNKYLDTEIIDVIQDTNGDCYEIRCTLNGKLIAYLSNN